MSSRIGLWTGVYSGITTSVGVLLGRPWQGLTLGYLAGLLVSWLEARHRASQKEHEP